MRARTLIAPTHLGISLRVPVVLKCKLVVAGSTPAPTSKTDGNAFCHSSASAFTVH